MTGGWDDGGMGTISRQRLPQRHQGIKGITGIKGIKGNTSPKGVKVSKVSRALLCRRRGVPEVSEVSRALL